MRHSLLLLLLVGAALALAGCGSLEDPPPVARPGLASPRPARSTATPRPTPDLSAFLHVPVDDPRAKGSPSAPITIIEYSDYE